MISKSDQIMSVEDSDLLLNDNWCLWWRFVKSATQKRYDASNLQEVFEFNSLDRFSQIYNGSPLGKVSNNFSLTEKTLNPRQKESEQQIMTNLPVDSYMLFRKNINPEWEDKKNASGGHFSIDFSKLEDEICDNIWKEISCFLVGEIWPHSEYVNGLRVLYKQAQQIKGNTLSS